MAICWSVELHISVDTSTKIPPMVSSLKTYELFIEASVLDKVRAFFLEIADVIINLADGEGENVVWRLLRSVAYT